MKPQLENPHLSRVFSVWQSMRRENELPGIECLTLDRLPQTLRNITISEMHGSDMVIRYHGDNLRAWTGQSLAGKSYWDFLPEEDAPCWFTAIRQMLETPCAMYGVTLFHAGPRRASIGMLGLPIRSGSGEVRHWITASAMTGSVPEESGISGNAPVSAPVPHIALKEVYPIDIGHGIPSPAP